MRRAKSYARSRAHLPFAPPRCRPASPLRHARLPHHPAAAALLLPLKARLPASLVSTGAAAVGGGAAAAAGGSSAAEPGSAGSAASAAAAAAAALQPAAAAAAVAGAAAGAVAEAAAGAAGSASLGRSSAPSGLDAIIAARVAAAAGGGACHLCGMLGLASMAGRGGWLGYSQDIPCHVLAAPCAAPVTTSAALPTPGLPPQPNHPDLLSQRCDALRATPTPVPLPPARAQATCCARCASWRPGSAAQACVHGGCSGSRVCLAAAAAEPPGPWRQQGGGR